MSIFRLSSDIPEPTPSSEQRLGTSADVAVLRATGVLSLLAIGTIHFLQIVSTLEATPLLGVAFLGLIAASLAVAARLSTHNDDRTWAASAVVCVAAIAGYIFTRTFSTPLDNQDAGNWSCMLGLAALFVETALLAFSVYAIAIKRALAKTAVPQQISSHSGRINPTNPSAA
jgi:hypothetical protein